MVTKKFLFSLVVLFTLIAATTAAQDDPNAQYVVLISGSLTGESREIDVPVEVGTLRAFFSVQAESGITWSIISPLERPLKLEQPNIAVTETNNKRVVAIWDPRPGKWRIKLTGTGAFGLAASTQSEYYACCMTIIGRQQQPQPIDKILIPRAGRQQAQVYFTGTNIETVNFSLVNEQSAVIAPVKFRQTDYSNPTMFMLFIEAPAQPFRVLARARDHNGNQFQRVYPPLFTPQDAAPLNVEAAPTAPPPVAPVQQEWDRGAVEGDYKIVRAQVVNYTDEPLLTEKGNVIGIRMKYAVRFPVDGYFAPIPNLYPERITSGYTGAISLKVQRSKVEPLPDDAQLPNQILYSGRGVYKRDTVYQFTVELVPNYAQYNETTKGFCLNTKPYFQYATRDRFEREVNTELKIKFRLSISGTDLDGRQPVSIEQAYAPSAWYAGYLKEGAKECQ